MGAGQPTRAASPDRAAAVNSTSGHLLPPPGDRLPSHPRKGFKGSRKQLVDEIGRLYRFVDEFKGTVGLLLVNPTPLLVSGSTSLC